MTLTLTLIIALSFLFIAIFAKEFRWCAFIIFIMSILNHEFSYLLNPLSYIQAHDIVLLWDSITIFLLCFFVKPSKFVLYQASLLAFAVLTHIMLLYQLTKGSNSLIYFVAVHYDELIILIGILQIMAAYNGFIAALSRSREYLLWTSFYLHCYSQSLFVYFKSKARA